MINVDMVWKSGELQSAYNKIRFYVELASPCTNLLEFCSLVQAMGMLTFPVSRAVRNAFWDR